MNLFHVTDVLSIANGEYRRVPADRLDAARRLGKETHRYALAALSNPDLALPVPKDHECAPFVEKILAWAKEHVAEVVAVERRISWESVQLTGRLDLVAQIRGDRCLSIVDLKRVASVPKVVGLQLAAYHTLAHYQKPFSRIERRFALHVPVDGPCRAVEYTNKGDAQAFISLLNAYRHMVGAGYIKPPDERREDD